MAIARPTKAYLQKTSLFLRYPTHKNLLIQLFPCLNDGPQLLFDIFNSTSEIKEREQNILVLGEVAKKGLLPNSIPANRGLINSFSGIKAAPEQKIDMLSFREIGCNELWLRYPTRGS